MSTLGQQTLHQAVVYTRPDALEGLGELTARLAEQLSLDLTLVPTVREDDDWRNTWKQFYAPILFGRPDQSAMLLRARAGSNRRPATRRWSWSSTPAGPSAPVSTRPPACASTRWSSSPPPAAGRAGIVDLGCGSGILALAAALLFPRRSGSSPSTTTPRPPRPPARTPSTTSSASASSASPAPPSSSATTST